MHDCARVFLAGNTAHTVKNKRLLTADCFIGGGVMGGGAVTVAPQIT